MRKTMKAALTWPLAAVIIAGSGCFTATLLWAPPSTQQWLFGANGIVLTLVAYFLRSPQDRVRYSEAPPAADAPKSDGTK